MDPHSLLFTHSPNFRISSLRDVPRAILKCFRCVGKHFGTVLMRFVHTKMMLFNCWFILLICLSSKICSVVVVYSTTMNTSEVDGDKSVRVCRRHVQNLRSYMNIVVRCVLSSFGWLFYEVKLFVKNENRRENEAQINLFVVWFVRDLWVHLTWYSSIIDPKSPWPRNAKTLDVGSDRDVLFPFDSQRIAIAWKRRKKEYV